MVRARMFLRWYNVAASMLFVAALACFVISRVMADPAIVIHNDGLCGMVGSDANGNLIFGGVGQVTHVVENDNKVTMTCKGSSLTNLSGRGQHYTAFGCGLPVPSGGFAFTTDSQATVSASGNGTMSCTFDK